TSASRINTSQRADGIQAVEKKVRIDLGLEGFQFSVASEHTGFCRLRFCAARVFHCNQHVVESDGKQIEKHSDGEDHITLLPKFAIERSPFLRAESGVEKRGRRLGPGKAHEYGGDQVC